MNGEKDRNKTLRTAGYTGIVLNLLLFIFKLFAGYISSSIAITADGFNNLSDAGSSVVSLTASRMAIKEADKQHPFGHGRIEYIAAFVVSCIIINVGFSTARESVKHIIYPENIIFKNAAVAVIIFSILIKIFLGFYYKRVAKETESSIYRANSIDSFSDTLSSAATLISLFIFFYTDKNIDAYIGFAVALLVLYNGIDMAKEMIESLIGKPTDPVLYKGIEEFIKAQKGVIGTHDLLIHNYGPDKYMASIDVIIDARNSVLEAHEIVDGIEHGVKKKFNVDISIHMDPIDIHDMEMKTYYRDCITLMKQLGVNADFHDFSIRDEGNDAKKVLEFDILMPWDIDAIEEKRLLREFFRQFKGRHPDINCDVKIERPYINIDEMEE